MHAVLGKREKERERKSEWKNNDIALCNETE